MDSSVIYRNKRIRAALLALVLAAAGVACGGRTQQPQLITSSPLQPTPVATATATITSISPTSAASGSGALTVTIDGSNFVPNENHISTWAVWTAGTNDTTLLTTFISTTQLTAVVPASLLTAPGQAEVSVQVGDSMSASDGVIYPKSNAVTFTVVAP